MTTTTRDLLIVFGSVQRVMRAEKAARDRGLDVDVIPAPRSVSSECGVVLEARAADTAALADMLDTLKLARDLEQKAETETGYYFNELGKPVQLAGNIGRHMLDFDEQPFDGPWIIERTGGNRWWQ